MQPGGAIMAIGVESVGASNPYSTYIVQDAGAFGLPANLFNAQIGQESSFNPNATNGNAIGIAQMMPGTAAMLGIDPTNPIQSLSGAAAYDAQLYQNTGSYVGMLQSYGTLPASGQPMNANQTNLFNMASALDQGNLTNGVNSPGGALGAAGGTAALGNLGGSSSSFGLSAQGGSGQGAGLGGWLAEVAERAALIVLGMVLIAGGIYLLGQRSGISLPVPLEALGGAA